MSAAGKMKDIPKGFILFISGVPGVGKTTISYELLKRFDSFRIIEETDVLRDALRGYNEFLIHNYECNVQDIMNEIVIYDHKKLLSFPEAMEQCQIMRNSFSNIIMRQKRKGIPTIINGVHIVAECLSDFLYNEHIVFINLYISEEAAIYERIKARDPHSYMLQHIPFIFNTNQELSNSTKKISNLFPKQIYNVDVTHLTLEETLKQIIKCINDSIS